MQSSNKMKLKILDGELGIVAIDGMGDLDTWHIEKIEKNIPDGANINDLVLLYMEDRDLIVLNRCANLYEFYSDIIPIYLQLSERSRKKAYDNAPFRNIIECYDILNYVIQNRSLMHDNVVI